MNGKHAPTARGGKAKAADAVPDFVPPKRLGEDGSGRKPVPSRPMITPAIYPTGAIGVKLADKRTLPVVMMHASVARRRPG